MQSSSERDPYLIHSVSHAADILRAFSSPMEVLRLRDFVARTSHSKGIAFRLLYTLEKSGLVEKIGPNLYRSTIQHRKTRKYKIGYASQGAEFLFCRDVTASLKHEADRLEIVELLVLNNRYNPKVAQKNADTFIKEGCDLVVEFQTDESAALLIAAKYREAGIPFIALEIPHPGATYYGANNFEAGLIGGRALGRWAKQNWDGLVDEILMMELARAGNVPRTRLTGMLAGIHEILPHLESCPVSYLDGDGRFQSSWKVVRKHLRQTAAKRTLIGGINDPTVLGAVRAFEEVGRAEGCAAMGQNASAEARDELRRPSRLIGSVAYFPEKYGERVLKLALDILTFRATPPAVFTTHQLITAKNVDSVYSNDLLLRHV